MKIQRIESRRDSRKQRVAAYARVSTEAEEQMMSFDTQVRYYTAYIQRNPQWEFCGVYADPGISGTSAEHRPEFQRMVADALDGKIDVILVKSISRFARNVVDAQRYVHGLKAHGVEIRFEREAISSFDASSDMVFNLLATVAQEESRSISENTKWSYRKNAEQGIRHMGNNRVLGYDEVNGELVPNDAAWMVKMVFRAYADGLPLVQIENRLRAAGAKGIRSGKPLSTDAILRILDNEIYVGDRLIQKRAPLNYLTKRPDHTVSFEQYYITDDHEAIIDRMTWERVRTRRKAQKNIKAQGVYKKSSAHFLYGLVFCGECGAPYKRRTVTSRNGESYKYWNCAERQKGKAGNGCKNRNIKETELLQAIAEQLGWNRVDVEHFDTEVMLRTVKRVEITGQGIHVDLVPIEKVS